MLTTNLGYPRIGEDRELKKSSEKYWSGKISRDELFQTGQEIRSRNFDAQNKVDLDLIPCNDFSFYDQVLDMAFNVGAIPDEYREVLSRNSENAEIDLYFAMARGYQKDGLDLKALEMTKWFNTNYHYLVPEFRHNQSFENYSGTIVERFKEARQKVGDKAKPVILGPVSFLLLGKEKEEGFNRLDLLDNLLPVYKEILNQLEEAGAKWVQFDEPFLALDLDDKAKTAYQKAYQELQEAAPNVKYFLATYFEGLRDNTTLALNLPVTAVHLDLIEAPDQIDQVLDKLPENKCVSLGLINGRNIWKTKYRDALNFIRKAVDRLGDDRVMIAPSCSLLHCPYDLRAETRLDPKIKNWLAFARQKLEELHELKIIHEGNEELLKQNDQVFEDKGSSDLIHRSGVKERVQSISDNELSRKSSFPERQKAQRKSLNLPYFPTTTIGSFPQTKDIRKIRNQLKKGKISLDEYNREIEDATRSAIKTQEEIGLDVLVHGEFERNDMVEYFGQELDGFTFTEYGWVQSFGSRCVKPPIIYGDVQRPHDITIGWSKFAQEQTGKPVKGMLTGPVTILQWSFPRNDQPRKDTAYQIALAMRDEVKALEDNGSQAIQIDEPAMREGLPLRQDDWDEYLNWAINAFKLSSAVVNDETQIHTHMCYAEFNDIIESIARMDADVITIETSRSQMELLEAFSDFKYPNEIGPGVYDIHSPRVPTIEEMEDLMEKASSMLPPENLWVNPDCGLKTRNWEETVAALKNMVSAAQKMRERVKENA